jgi:hypothetical protein
MRKSFALELHGEWSEFAGYNHSATDDDLMSPTSAT